jgi:hypothetical protein
MQPASEWVAWMEVTFTIRPPPRAAIRRPAARARNTGPVTITSRWRRDRIELGQRLWNRDPRDVDQRVERTEALLDVGDQLLVAVDLADVTAKRRHAVGGDLLDIEAGDGVAVGHEPQGDRAADAVRRAGDCCNACHRRE